MAALSALRYELALLRDWAPVIYRGLLYFTPVYLAPFIDKICPILFQDKWPSLPALVGSHIIGTAAGVIVLRSYSDGSWQRHAETLKARQGDTALFYLQGKPTPAQSPTK